MELLTWIQADLGLAGIRLVVFDGFVDHESFRAELCNWPKSPVSWTGLISSDDREHIAQESQAMAICPSPEVSPMVCQSQSSVFSARKQPTSLTAVYGLPAGKRSKQLQSFLATLSALDVRRLYNLRDRIDTLPIFQRTEVTYTTGNENHLAVSEATVQVLDCMKFLDAMEDVQAATSFRVNCAYWILGDTYANFETSYLNEMSADGVSFRYSRTLTK